MNLASLVTTHEASSPALYEGSGWITWGELRSRAAGVAAVVREGGAGPGDRIALVLPSSVDFVAGYLGVLAAGAVAVPLNPQSPAPELQGELAGTEPVLCFAADHARGALGETTVCPVVDGFPAPVEGDLLPVVERHHDDLAVLLYTSGTAGAPRAAMLSHGNLIANLRQMQSITGGIAAPDDIGLGAVPLFHIFGLNVTLGLALAVGGALVLEERFDPLESLDLIERLGVTSILG
ncbi:MAG: AMP-binding protein, partial [Acidimicrobiales bacterium]